MMIFLLISLNPTVIIICVCVAGKILKFADGTKVYHTVYSDEDVSTLQADPDLNPNHNANAIPIPHLCNACYVKIAKNCANTIAKYNLTPTLGLVMTLTITLDCDPNHNSIPVPHLYSTFCNSIFYQSPHETGYRLISKSVTFEWPSRSRIDERKVFFFQMVV